jgi:Icc-related predicted phosphoesterase
MKESLRLAAVADIHCNKASHGLLQPIFTEANRNADVLLLGGDLTNTGLPDEAHVLVKELTAVTKIPIIAVLGNHDCENEKQVELEKIFTESGIIVLDGDSYVIEGVGFVGVKGFAGGFDNRSLQPWGEESIKQIVRATVNEALKLESALARVEANIRVVLLHYSPVKATIEGESLEIYPFLGSSHLEDAIDHYDVTVVFHGHAHHGKPEGRTKAQVPVFNVAMPLLKELFPQAPPFRIYEIPLKVAA